MFFSKNKFKILKIIEFNFYSILLMNLIVIFTKLSLKIQNNNHKKQINSKQKKKIKTMNNTIELKPMNKELLEPLIEN